MDLPIWASPLWYVVPAAVLGMMYFYLPLDSIPEMVDYLIGTAFCISRLA